MDKIIFKKNLYLLITQYFHNSVLSSTQSALWRFGLTYTPPKLKDILLARLKMLHKAGTNTSHLPKSNVTDVKCYFRTPLEVKHVV